MKPIERNTLKSTSRSKTSFSLRPRMRPAIGHPNGDTALARGFGQPSVAGVAVHCPADAAYNEGRTKGQLLGLFAAADLTPRQTLRISKSPIKDLGLTDEGVSDQALLAAMIEHPVLVNRPIVCTAKGVRLCRPSEGVLDLLEQWPAGPFYKDDGKMILDANGKRLI